MVNRANQLWLIASLALVSSAVSVAADGKINLWIIVGCAVAFVLTWRAEEDY